MNSGKLFLLSGIAAAVTVGVFDVPAPGQTAFFSDVDVAGPGEIRSWTAGQSAPFTVADATEAGNSPIGVAADETSVYWINWGDDNTGNIMRADHDGQNQSVVYSNLYQYGGEYGGHLSQQLTIDPDSGQLFWTAYGAGVFRGSVDGSTTPTLVGGDALESHTSVAYDPHGNHVYYSYPYEDGSIYRLDADGTDQGLGVEILSASESNTLAVDTDRNRLYFTDISATHTEAPNTIWYLDLADTGAGPTMLVQDEDHLNNILSLAVLPGGDYLYYSDRGNNAIGRISLNGDPVAEDLVTTDFSGSGPFGLAVIPEPGTAAVLFAGGSLLLRRRNGRN